MRTPGSPVIGVQDEPADARHVAACARATPSVTLTWLPSRSVMPSAMLTSYGARTCADPPPMFVVSTACRPMSATVAPRRQWQRPVPVAQHGHPGGGQAGQLLAASRAVGLGSSRPSRRASRRAHRRDAPAARGGVRGRRRPRRATAPLSTAATSAAPHGPCSAGHHQVQTAVRRRPRRTWWRTSQTSAVRPIPTRP